VVVETLQVSRKAALSMSIEVERSAVILDAQPLWLDALVDVLEAVDVNVVARATRPERALETLEEHRPDLFVTELELSRGGMDGFTCIRRARELLPDVRIIVLSGRRDPDAIQQGISAGAAAYVIKTAHPGDIAAAVRQAFDHSIFLAGIATTKPTVMPDVHPETNAGLTKRELEILRLVAEGHSNGHLARMLWVTEQTVKFHLSNIYRKLDVGNRTEASRWAQRHGVLDAETHLVLA
jgi:DNA-binding NarL/FixJ family response regulator